LTNAVKLRKSIKNFPQKYTKSEGYVIIIACIINQLKKVTHDSRLAISMPAFLMISLKPYMIQLF
jgi:hypothetical protein